MTRVAVTGVTGFVGRQLVPALLEEGYAVRGLVHLEPDAASLPAQLEIMRGDVRSADTARSLMNGADMVVHLAPGLATRPDTVESVLLGTRNVVQAAREAQVQRLVSLSCLGADAAATFPFYAAKWKAESLVRASGVPFVILRPSLVLGRGDGVVQPVAGLVKSLPVTPVPGRGETRQQPIDVADLARCVLLSLRDDASTDQLIAVGGPTFLTFRQLVDLVSGELGISKPKVLLPLAWLSALAPAIPPDSRHLFLPPRVAQFQQGVVASPGIVSRTFGFQPISVVQRLRDYLV